MPDAVIAFCRQFFSAAHNRVSEIVRTCTVYLGIAVLVAAGVVFALPGLRGQALHVHAALLAALAPDAARQGGNHAMLADSVHSPAGTVAGVDSFLNAIGTQPPAAVLVETGASSGQVEALRSYISRKYKVAYDATGVLVSTAYVVGHDLALDPLLLLAVIAIESRYNPFAESTVGAQGLMQVMTSVHQEKFQPFGGGDGAALNPVANIRVGAQILKDCIQRRGSLTGGLACYVGATGPGDGGYGAKVLAERRRLALAAGVALARD